MSEGLLKDNFFFFNSIGIIKILQRLNKLADIQITLFKTFSKKFERLSDTNSVNYFLKGYRVKVFYTLGGMYIVAYRATLCRIESQKLIYGTHLCLSPLFNHPRKKIPERNTASEYKTSTFKLSLKAVGNEKTLLQKHRVNVAHYVVWMSKRGESNTSFAPERQTVRLQPMLRGYTNEETFEVSVSSVSPKCFLVCIPTQHVLMTQNLHLESKKCI